MRLALPRFALPRLALSRLAGIPALAMLLLGATTAQAEGPALDADAFNRATLGFTLGYAHVGATYGHEQYLPDHRVIWAFAGDDCLTGRWQQRGEQICFSYDRDGPEQCWRFWLQDGKLVGRYADDPPGDELYELSRSPTPLSCAPPDVGM